MDDAEGAGGHNIVAEFLYQVGLPLDRCASFTQHVRKVERRLGLPEPDDPEAGEQLREAVLDSLLPVSVPTLKHALRGPAGSRIREVALNVVLRGDFKSVNPLLGGELERIFESARPVRCAAPRTSSENQISLLVSRMGAGHFHKGKVIYEISSS